MGATLPTDHGFALYGALARLIPAVHDSKFPVRIGPVRGVFQGRGLLQLEPRWSRVRLRLPVERLADVLPLAGKSIEVDGHRFRLGVPQVQSLIAAPNLAARLVVIKASSPLTQVGVKSSRDQNLTKRYLEPTSFLEAVRRDLARLNIAAQADLPIHENGPRLGQPRRHVVTVHGKKIVGFTVLVQGLTAEESIRLQERGLGGKGKMGCGFFVAVKGNS